MRLLVLSESIYEIQRIGEKKFIPPSDVQLDVGNLNNQEGLRYSVFDYDVAILHIHVARNNSLGYIRNIPKVAQDTLIALEHGRSVICLPRSPNFRPGTYGETETQFIIG